MYSRAAFILITSSLLAACNQPPETDSSKYEPILDAHQMMEWVLDPAVDVIWDSAGTIITAEGEQDLSPTTDAGWDEVVRQSAILAEAGNLLMMPERSAGPDWDKHSAGLIRTGKLAMAAAASRDKDALFDAGGQIYQVCLACHNQYWIVLDETTP